MILQHPSSPFFILQRYSDEVILLGGSSRFVNFQDRLRTALGEAWLQDVP